MKISSRQNPKIKRLLSLKKARSRKETDLVLVEGLLELETARESGAAVGELYCSEDFFEKNPGLDEAFGQKPIVLEKKLFGDISWCEHPKGILGLVKPTSGDLARFRPGVNPLIVLVEGVEKPGNLGAILRSADAAGVSGVIFAGQRTDIYNPNAVRASLGAVFSVPVFSAGLDDGLAWFREKKIRIIAAHPEAEKEHSRADFSGPVAIAVGEEHSGLSEKLLAAADERVVIPMRGRVNSLNASVSAAIMMFEAARQRRK